MHFVICICMYICMYTYILYICVYVCISVFFVVSVMYIYVHAGLINTDETSVPSDLKSEKIRVLTYMNPFMVDFGCASLSLSLGKKKNPVCRSGVFARTLFLVLLSKEQDHASFCVAGCAMCIVLLLSFREPLKGNR